MAPLTRAGPPSETCTATPYYFDPVSLGPYYYYCCYYYHDDDDDDDYYYYYSLLSRLADYSGEVDLVSGISCLLDLVDLPRGGGGLLIWS